MVFALVGDSTTTSVEPLPRAGASDLLLAFLLVVLRAFAVFSVAVFVAAVLLVAIRSLGAAVDAGTPNWVRKLSGAGKISRASARPSPSTPAPQACEAFASQPSATCGRGRLHEPVSSRPEVPRGGRCPGRGPGRRAEAPRRVAAPLQRTQMPGGRRRFATALRAPANPSHGAAPADPAPAWPPCSGRARSDLRPTDRSRCPARRRSDGLAPRRDRP